MFPTDTETADRNLRCGRKFSTAMDGHRISIRSFHNLGVESGSSILQVTDSMLYIESSAKRFRADAGKVSASTDSFPRGLAYLRDSGAFYCGLAAARPSHWA
jgi:hypothetical protein